MSRFAQEGLLLRVKKGLYYYPKVTALSLSRPSHSALLEKMIMQESDGPIFSGGTASFQNLGLTTQVPVHYTLISTQAPRTFQIGEMTAKVQRRDLAHLAGVSQHEMWLLDAIRNLKHVPDSTPSDALVKILDLL